VSPRRAGALSLAALLMGASGAQADPRFTVTWHPLSLLSYGWQFEFEAAPSRWISVHASPTTVITVDDGLPRPLGFAMDVGVRVFPFGRAPSGFLLGAHMGAATWNVADLEPTADGFAVRGGLTVGYTFVFARRFVLSVGGGGEYVRFTPSWQGAESYGRAWPFVRLAVGVAF